MDGAKLKRRHPSTPFQMVTTGNRKQEEDKGAIQTLIPPLLRLKESHWPPWDITTGTLQLRVGEEPQFMTFGMLLPLCTHKIQDILFCFCHCFWILHGPIKLFTTSYNIENSANVIGSQKLESI